MPRLGSGGTPGNDGGNPARRPAASAYPNPQRGGMFSNVILLLALTFVLRNIMFKDYRTEEINRLQERGVSEEEIKKIVPQTASERRAELKESALENIQLKKEVLLLKDQVKELRIKVGLEEEEPSTDRKGEIERSHNAEDEIYKEKSKNVNSDAKATERRIQEVSKVTQDKVRPRAHHSHHKSTQDKKKEEVTMLGEKKGAKDSVSTKETIRTESKNKKKKTAAVA